MFTFLLKNRKIRFLALLVISTCVTYLAGRDAITTSRLYNSIDEKDALNFKINEKYNKRPEGVPIP